jgi:hypothetical protein
VNVKQASTAGCKFCVQFVMSGSIELLQLVANIQNLWKQKTVFRFSDGNIIKKERLIMMYTYVSNMFLTITVSSFISCLLAEGRGTEMCYKYLGK